MLGEDIFFESYATGLGIIGQEVDAVAGAYGNQALELPFGLGFNVFQKGKFAAQNLDEEIAIATGGLKKAAIEPERLIAHQVEHSVYLPRISEHLAMVSHPLAAFNLGFVFVCCGHKKSVKLSVWNGGSAKP